MANDPATTERQTARMTNAIGEEFDDAMRSVIIPEDSL